MLEIEFEEPIYSICACCQQSTTRLTGFVYKNNDAYAIYYAQFTDGHDKKRLSGIIGLGEWDDDEIGPKARVAFPFQIWVTDENSVVGLVDASDSQWSHFTHLGRILDRNEALTHPWVKDVFHITDRMLTDDQAIVDYFR